MHGKKIDVIMVFQNCSGPCVKGVPTLCCVKFTRLGYMYGLCHVISHDFIYLFICSQQQETLPSLKTQTPNLVHNPSLLQCS